jgi:DNA ligase-1
MKTKSFKPLLAPNQEVDLDNIKYPLLASHKLDGIRCIFYKGEILSRSLKPIQNKQLREKFEPLRKFSEEFKYVIDGEIYSPELKFQDIVSFVMTKDLEDKKSIKKFGKVMEIPEHLKFYCFDIIEDGGLLDDCYFSARIETAKKLLKPFNDIIEVLEHHSCPNPKTIEFLFEDALENGYEGLILRDPQGRYKFGRGTIKEGIIYKVKPYRTFDAKITGVVQATVVREDAEKKVNELGRSVTSKKKDDRVLIEKASAFWVKYEGKDLKVTLAMTDEEKEEVWKNRESYIGKWIEYKGLCVGMKNVPRHPVMTRFRNDKDKD